MKKTAKKKGYKEPKTNIKNWTLDAGVKPAAYGTRKKKKG
jgi:hypothetical protein